jgi:hypothetical protein
MRGLPTECGVPNKNGEQLRNVFPSLMFMQAKENPNSNATLRFAGVLAAIVLVAVLAAAYFWGFHGKKDQRAPEAPQTGTQQSYRTPALR